MAGLPTPEEIGRAHASVIRWRDCPHDAAVCPRCAAPRLSVLDRSARPFAEWYVLSCAACGFEHTLHIPLAPPSGNY